MTLAYAEFDVRALYFGWDIVVEEEHWYGGGVLLGTFLWIPLT
jgi:hypothetical protein